MWWRPALFLRERKVWHTRQLLGQVGWRGLRRYSQRSNNRETLSSTYDTDNLKHIRLHIHNQLGQVFLYEHDIQGKQHHTNGVHTGTLVSVVGRGPEGSTSPHPPSVQTYVFLNPQSNNKQEARQECKHPPWLLCGAWNSLVRPERVNCFLCHVWHILQKNYVMLLINTDSENRK